MRSNPKNILLLILSASILFPFTLQAATFGLSDIPRDFKFNRTLKQGDTVVPDVSYLQFVLNQSPSTVVSATGAGSLTGLTNFFGAKTQSAIIRFQEKYRDEILTPAKVANPTGVVGAYTRNKLNQILASLFAGTYIDAESTTPLSTTLANSAATNASNNALNLFNSSLSSSNAGTNSGSSTVKRPPIISSFSTFKALSGQLMSIFGVQFHPTDNILYLGTDRVGNFPSQNGSKITFQIPTALETGRYEIGLVNAYGTTSTGSVYVDVQKQTPASSTLAQSFEPTLTTLFPNTSKNLNDLVYLYGENFSFTNTLETNLGNTSVRSTDRKTLSFLISELPYYTEAFKKYKGQSINVLMKLRNENGLSKQQLVHVINFPNTDAPTVNTTTQTSGLRATSTLSGGSSNNSSDSSSNSSSIQLDPATQQLGQILGGSLLVQTVMETSPIHKFVLGPLVGGGSSSGGSGGSSGGSSSSGGGLSSLLGGGGGGSGGGSGGSSSGGGSGNVTFFGGKITQVTYCTCSAAILLAIQDIPSKQTLQVFFRYGQSTLHANYNIFTSGINVIGGLTSGGGSCEVYNGESCDSQGNADYTIDTIRGVGTGV